MRVAIESGPYVSACTHVFDANHGVADVMVTLSTALAGGSDMAGTDTGGEAFAAQYDQTAAQLMQMGSQLTEALATVANLLDASLANHEGADRGALVYGPFAPGESPTGDTNPDHVGRTVDVGAPPSATGGVGGEPGWWHYIASHLEGLLWPDADTGRLRSIGDGWKTASTTIASYSWEIDSAKVDVSIQRSPEVPDALATLGDLERAVTSLSTNFATMGQACHDYADQVDAHHQEIEDQLASFIKWTAVIEGGGLFLGFATAGLGELAAQAGEGAEVANAAAKVVAILRDLKTFAEAAVDAFVDVLRPVDDFLIQIKRVLDAKAIAALAKVGIKIGEVDIDSLPAWARSFDDIPHQGPGSELYQGFGERQRYGGLTRQQFYDKYWDPELGPEGGWRYPVDNGFAGDPVPSDLRPNPNGDGPIIDRLGGNGGKFASPSGESYSSRALPPTNIGREYHQFQVIKPLPESVTKGKIAPAFGQAGGGTQYYFEHGVQWYVDHGYLKQIR